WAVSRTTWWTRHGTTSGERRRTTNANSGPRYGIPHSPGTWADPRVGCFPNGCAWEPITTIFSRSLQTRLREMLRNTWLPWLFTHGRMFRWHLHRTAFP